MGEYYLEAKHFPSDEGYILICDVCSKHLESQNALKCHLYQMNSRGERDAAKLSGSVHFPGHFSYNCDHCKKTFKTKKALCSHVSTVHKS